MKTVAQEALELLEPVPADKWTCHRFRDHNNNMCALALYATKKHPKAKIIDDGSFWDRKSVLSGAVRKLNTASIKFAKTIGRNFSISIVNNDESSLYNEKTAKDRVIHLLKDMVKAGY